MATIFFRRLGLKLLGRGVRVAHCLLKELVKRLVETSRDPRAGFRFRFRLLSVARQRGNAASLLGTLPVDSVGEEFCAAVYSSLCYFYYNQNKLKFNGTKYKNS